MQMPNNINKIIIVRETAGNGGYIAYPDEFFSAAIVGQGDTPLEALQNLESAFVTHSKYFG
jgi:predicted RNase H-like HicB family nuclease